MKGKQKTDVIEQVKVAVALDKRLCLSVCLCVFVHVTVLLKLKNRDSLGEIKKKKDEIRQATV